MTTNFNPRLYVENGAAIAAQEVRRRHEIIRAALAGPAKQATAVNDDEPVPTAVCFAI
ncbi:MAG TPA: hypothetical protein VFO42_03580 [Sphingomicrobium sp.]|nr:hypothetical protein [Sphingomicrobium sp.]